MKLAGLSLLVVLAGAVAASPVAQKVERGECKPLVTSQMIEPGRGYTLTATGLSLQQPRVKFIPYKVVNANAPIPGEKEAIAEFIGQMCDLWEACARRGQTELQKCKQEIFEYRYVPGRHATELDAKQDYINRQPGVIEY